MRDYRKTGLIILTIMVLGYGLWPFMEPYLPLLKQSMLDFRKYCHLNPSMSYMLFTVLLSATIMVGLPLVTLWMLAAGLFYNFWEATAVVTFSRLLAAGIIFAVARRMIKRGPRPSRRDPYILRTLYRHPNISLLLARLAPIPDAAVSYTSAAAPINRRDYLLVSLVGMIPFTLFCIWMGQQLGNITNLMRWVQ